MLRGRFPGEIRIVKVRDLTEADVRRLDKPRKSLAAPTRKLRYSHHMMALLDAQGHSVKEIAELTGYSTTTIYQVQKSPAYEMLRDEKRQKIEEANVDLLAGHMRNKIELMVISDRHLRDHFEELDEAGELMPIKQALAISADMADRVGYGKHSSQTHHDGDFKEKFEAALLRSGKVLSQRPSEPKPLPLSLQPPQAVSAGPSSSGSESPRSEVPLPTVQTIFKRRF